MLLQIVGSARPFIFKQRLNVHNAKQWDAVKPNAPKFQRYSSNLSYILYTVHYVYVE